MATHMIGYFDAELTPNPKTGLVANNNQLVEEMTGTTYDHVFPDEATAKTKMAGLQARHPTVKYVLLAVVE